ncbi:MAG: cytochrome b/b6 domain-containing protein [Hyphomicrobium sp.]
MPQQPIKSYRVWDVPTRLFHWINFICVVALAAIGTTILYDKELGVTDAGKILLKTTHVWFGYAFAVSLILRLLWAFFGNKHARWAAILPFGKGYCSSLAGYFGALRRGEPPAYVGHNPAARAMVFVLLVLLAVQAGTGLLLAGTDIYYPPFGQWITGWIASAGTDPATLAPYNMTGVDKASWEAMRAFRSPIVSAHYWVFYALLAAILVHVAGVVVAELREGGGLVSAMLTGRKVFDRAPVDDGEEGQ